MTPADSWAELAQDLLEKDAQYPDLRHVWIEYSEAREIATAKIVVAHVVALPRFRTGQVLLAWPDLGQAQIFYGERDPLAWQRFVELADDGVDLAIGSRLISPNPQPDPSWTAIETVHRTGAWMRLVYDRVRKRRPGSRRRVREWSHCNRKRLPDGMRIAELWCGVFRASAFAAELLAGDAKVPSCEKEQLPDLVTLDQAAAAVCKHKRTLERLKSGGHLPQPSIKGGGGRAHQWEWRTIRPCLEAEFKMKLPETFPANRNR
jgi:hypothetical protein